MKEAETRGYVEKNKQLYKVEKKIIFMGKYKPNILLFIVDKRLNLITETENKRF